MKNAIHPTTQEDKDYLKKFNEYNEMAELYNAYHHIYRYIEDPFENLMSGTVFDNAIFNCARFLTNALLKKTPPFVSKVNIYYALGKLGAKHEAFKTARIGYEKLQGLRVPVEWQEQIDLASLKIRSKPFSDNEALQPVCNRCFNANALINLNGDKCTACGHPFVRNFVGFDTLPLVEFQPREGILTIVIP